MNSAFTPNNPRLSFPSLEQEIDPRLVLMNQLLFRNNSRRVDGFYLRVACYIYSLTERIINYLKYAT